MDELRFLIPIVAMAIPLTIVTGIFIVHPIVKAIGKAKPGADPRIGKLVEQLEVTRDRLDHVERQLRQVEEAQAFDRKLIQPARPEA